MNNNAAKLSSAAMRIVPIICKWLTLVNTDTPRALSYQLANGC